MKCAHANSLFSPYLDGAVTGTQMRDLGQHLEACVSCRQEYDSLRKTQQLLIKAGRRKAPVDLALKLRVAISHEVAQSKRARLDGRMVRLENALNAFMVPATAGLGNGSCNLFASDGLPCAFTGRQPGCSVDAVYGAATAAICFRSRFGFNQRRFAGHRGLRGFQGAGGRLPHFIQSEGCHGIAAASQEYAHLHHVPSGDFDGETHNGTGRAVIFQDQRERIRSSSWALGL